MLNTFIITGYGRSGTKFLATQLAKSKVWKVEHEPSPNLLNIQYRFNTDYYGEVNSYLLYTLLSCPVNCKVVIIRDPYAILQSCYNNDHPLTIQTDIQIAITLLLTYINAGIPYFRFSELIRSKGKIIELARLVGIKDLSEDDITLDPINKSKFKRLDFYREVHAHVKEDFDYFMSKLGVPREKHTEL